MRRILLCLLLLAFGGVQAEVVRPAPDFAWVGINGKRQTLKSLRGQPVVLVIAESGRSGKLRAQIKRLEELYRFFSATKVVFVAALRSEESPLQSDIPFVQAAEPAGVAADYGADRGFGIAIIGPDGNLDYGTYEVLPAARVRDVINNSFAQQANIRPQE